MTTPYITFINDAISYTDINKQHGMKGGESQPSLGEPFIYHVSNNEINIQSSQEMFPNSFQIP